MSLSYFLLHGSHLVLFFFFFNDTATTEIYTLSLHDALPISRRSSRRFQPLSRSAWSIKTREKASGLVGKPRRSEEHTSELQSRLHLVCRLLLEKKKKKQNNRNERIKQKTH